MDKMTERLFTWGMRLSFGLALFCLFMAAVHAHTMNVTECHSFAWDVKQAAADRAKATLKMQMAALASSLEICKDSAHKLTCIYKDDSDDMQAINALNWIYDGDGSKMTAQQIHDIAEENCTNKLMDKLNEGHTYGKTDMR